MAFAPVQPLSFIVGEAVAAESAAYTLLHNCKGQMCSFQV